MFSYVDKVHLINLNTEWRRAGLGQAFRFSHIEVKTLMPTITIKPLPFDVLMKLLQRHQINVKSSSLCIT